VNKKTSLFRSLSLGLLSLASFSIQASNEIRITAPIPEANPERWIDATMRGKWRDIRTGCSWDPPSSSVAYTLQVNQTGTCGVTQAREVRPLERSTKTGRLRETAPPYDEFQVTNPFYKTRTVYGDFTAKIVSKYFAWDGGQTYVGARKGWVGTPATFTIPGFISDGSAGFTLKVYSAQPNKVIGSLYVTSQNYETSKAFGYRYSHVDILGPSGNVLVTYAMPYGGGSGSEFVGTLIDTQSKLSFTALWSIMSADPGAVTGFRLYNPNESSE